MVSILKSLCKIHVLLGEKTFGRMVIHMIDRGLITSTWRAGHYLGPGGPNTQPPQPNPRDEYVGLVQGFRPLQSILIALGDKACGGLA